MRSLKHDSHNAHLVTSNLDKSYIPQISGLTWRDTPISSADRNGKVDMHCTTGHTIKESSLSRSLSGRYFREARQKLITALYLGSAVASLATSNCTV